MGNLFRFEIRRLLHQKSFYICCLVLLVLCVIPIFLLSFLSSNVAGVTTIMGKNGVSMTGKYFLMVAISGSSLDLLLAIFISLYICGNFSSGAVKNVLSRGYGRSRLLAASLFAVLTAVAIMILLSLGSSLAVGTLIGELGSGWSVSLIPILLVQSLTVFALAAVYAAIAFLMRKAGAAIAVSILLSALVSPVASLIDLWLFREGTFKIADYTLSSILVKLSEVTVPANVLQNSAIYVMIYLIIGVCVSLLAFRKREV